MTIISQLTVVILAEVGALDKKVDSSVSQAAGQVTLVWLVAIVILLGLAAITFKKSKRTHLD